METAEKNGMGCGQIQIQNNEFLHVLNILNKCDESEYQASVIGREIEKRTIDGANC